MPLDPFPKKSEQAILIWVMRLITIENILIDNIVMAYLFKYLIEPDHVSPEKKKKGNGEYYY